jgi:hypothetical protein
VTALVPAFAPRPGLLGLPQRAATAALWFLMPLARRSGNWRETYRARRRR